MKVHSAAAIGAAADGAAVIDRLDPMLERFSVRARQFHVGPLCELRRFDAEPGRGFLHILRAGALHVEDGRMPGLRTVSEPSLLFYPRPHEHLFHARADRPVDLACATLEFDGGGAHPLVRALPDVVTVPIAEVEGLDRSLDLLFAEIDEFRCGHRYVVDRLFEIALLKLLRWLLDHPRDVGLPPGLFTGLADPAIARALAGMHEDPGRSWTLETLGRLARMSRSAFAARFRELVGTPPHEYLTGWRITIGQQRLREGRPVAQIAAELGYTGSSFSRVFAQRTGSSPRAWAEDQRGRALREAAPADPDRDGYAGGDTARSRASARSSTSSVAAAS
ncbi:AraC family transcriptional regulator [Leucobacter sp.]